MSCFCGGVPVCLVCRPLPRSVPEERRGSGADGVPLPSCGAVLGVWTFVPFWVHFVCLPARQRARSFKRRTTSTYVPPGGIQPLSFFERSLFCRCVMPQKYKNDNPARSFWPGSFAALSRKRRYASPVPRVTGIGKDSSPDTLDCMLDNCKEEVINCAKDPACRACISCLTACPPNDQARRKTRRVKRYNGQG